MDDLFEFIVQYLFLGTSKNKWKLVSQNYGRLDAYFSSHVMQSQEHYYLTPLKLFAQIGGYIGLFRLSLFLLDLFQCSKFRQDEKLVPKIEKRFPGKKKNPHEVMADEQLIHLSSFALDTL